MVPWSLASVFYYSWTQFLGDLVGTRSTCLTTDSFLHNLSLSLAAVSCACALCLWVEAQGARLFLCCKTVLASSSFLWAFLHSPPWSLAVNEVNAIGNSVFVRLPNNLWTGDDPIQGEGVLRQSEMAKYGSCPLSFAFVRNFLAVFTAFSILPFDSG